MGVSRGYLGGPSHTIQICHGPSGPNCEGLDTSVNVVTSLQRYHMVSHRFRLPLPLWLHVASVVGPRWLLLLLQLIMMMMMMMMLN